eukprot:6209487-Pleurochrysis_carterae.AAC.2
MACFALVQQELAQRCTERHRWARTRENGKGGAGRRLPGWTGSGMEGKGGTAGSGVKGKRVRESGRERPATSKRAGRGCLTRQARWWASASATQPAR